MEKRQVHTTQAVTTDTVNGASGSSMTFDSPIAGLRAIQSFGCRKVGAPSTQFSYTSKQSGPTSNRAIQPTPRAAPVRSARMPLHRGPHGRCFVPAPTRHGLFSIEWRP